MGSRTVSDLEKGLRVGYPIFFRILTHWAKHVRYSKKIAPFECQNSNAGFARPDLWTSAFEDIFYAVNVLQTLGKT